MADHRASLDDPGYLVTPKGEKLPKFVSKIFEGQRTQGYPVMV
jgi:hypothetical protein